VKSVLSEHLDESTVLGTAASIGIVVSTYYKDIAQGLLSGVSTVLAAQPLVNHEIVQVFGAWEIPLLAKIMAQSNRFQGLIALGCIVRGQTVHFDHLCEQCSSALMTVSMDHTIPVGFGVLTVENMQQARHRSGTQYLHRNKGYEAAIGVMESIQSIQAAAEIHHEH